MDDLTYHLDAQQAMKKERVSENRRVEASNPWYWGTLQSLRSHPKFGEVATNLQAELETFRLHELASMDHAIGMNGQIATHCQQRLLPGPGRRLANERTILTNDGHCLYSC